MLKALITSGGTKEMIDGVRFITNFSSGETGASIANNFALQNFDVHFLHAYKTKKAGRDVKHYEFSDFKSLDFLLRDLLKKYSFDIIIHAAAVSDYSFEKLIVGGKEYFSTENKINSSHNDMTIKLKKNFKIINFLKSYSKENENLLYPPCLVGFKLTKTQSAFDRKNAIEKLFLNSGADYVVHNDMNDIEKYDLRLFDVYERNRKIKTCRSRSELSSLLIDLFLYNNNFHKPLEQKEIFNDINS